MTATLRWRKSGRSQNTTDCVELAHTFDVVRDSKNGAILMVPNLAALIDAIKQSPQRSTPRVRR